MLKAMLGVILAGCILLVGIGVVIAVFGPSSSSHQSAYNDSEPASERVSAPVQTIRVSAPKLSLEYHENEVQADNLYKNQWLSVRGIVMEIRKDFTEEIVIALGPTENEFEPVDAHLLARDSAKAAVLHKWQTVEMICKGDGMVVGSPQLSNCTFQEAVQNDVRQSSDVSQSTYQQNSAPTSLNGDVAPPTTSSGVDNQEAPAPIVGEQPAGIEPHN